MFLLNYFIFKSLYASIYVQNTTGCDESIDIRYFNDDTDRIKQRSMYKRCVPSAFKVRWHEGLPGYNRFRGIRA